MSDLDNKDAYPDRPAAGSYNNMGISAATIKSMQKWYGVSADGKWGQGSYDAAGYRNAADANQFWRDHYNNGTSTGARANSYAELGKKWGLYDSGGVLQGMGGIKATMRDEIVLPPDITAKMLRPTATAAFRARVTELGGLYGETPVDRSVAGNITNNDRHDVVNNYSINGITLTEQQAETLCMAKLVRLAHHIKPYGG